MAQQAMDAQTAAQNAPSMGGSFIREAARSFGPGLAGFASGSASGAALGAAGLNPVTVALGAVGGGVAGFMGARKISDVAADAIAPDSFMGTKSAEQDMAANKWSTMLGGAIGGGGAPGPLRGVMAIPRLMTAEGRQVLGTGLRPGATVAARQASNDILEPIVGAGVGVGLGAAHGADGVGLAEQAGLGLVFNRGWMHRIGRGQPPLSTDSQYGVQGDPATGLPVTAGVVPIETNAAVVTPMVGDGLNPSRAFDIMESNALANRLKTAQPLETPPPVSEPLTFDGGPQVRGPMVRGPVVEGPIVRGPLVEGPRGPIVGETLPREAWQGPEPLAPPQVRGPQIDSPTMDGPLGPLVEGPRVGSNFPAIEQSLPLRSPAVVAPDGPTMLGPSVDRPFVDGPLGPEVLGPAKIKIGQDTFTDSPAPEVIPQAEIPAVPVAESRPALPPAPAEPSRQLGQRPFNSTEVASRLRTAVEPPAPVPVPVTPTTPAARELSARTRANNLKAEIEDLGRQILAQRQKIDQMKKDGKLPRGISTNEKKLAALQDLQNQRKATLAETKAEIPRFVKTLSAAANNLLRAVEDSLPAFPGFNSLKEVGTRIKMPSPQLALILGKEAAGTPLSSREKNFLAFNKKSGEYDGYIKLSDIDEMPGTPAGREAARHFLKSIYDTHDSTTASGPDNAVAGKTAGDLWAELRSEVEDIARGKTRDATDALDAIYDRQERQLVEFDKAVEEAPAVSKATPDELGLEKGDTLTIDGEPITVAKVTDDTVTLRDHDRFGDQVVPVDQPIPADNLKQAKSRIGEESLAADEAATRRQADEFAEQKARLAQDAPDAIAADEARTARQAAKYDGVKPKPLTPEHDAAYTKAVESGDEVTQQRLVDEAGESAGLGKPWYHGGKKGITKFSELIRPGSTRDQKSLHSQGIWLTRSRGGNPEIDGSSYDATTYAGLDGQVYRLFAKIKNPARIFDEEIARKRITIDSLKAEGFDGADLAQSGFKVAFDPAQIHSAEPVVRDSSGRIIPLSERFGSKPADEARTARQAAKEVSASRVSSIESAVRRGDMDTAQRLIDDDATESGHQNVVYHGTPREITSQLNRKAGQGEGDDFESWGIWTTQEKSSARKYGDNIHKLYGKSEAPKNYRGENSWMDWARDYAKTAYPRAVNALTAQTPADIRRYVAEHIESERIRINKGNTQQIPKYGKKSKAWEDAYFPGAEAYHAKLKADGFDSVMINGARVDGVEQNISVFLDPIQLKHSDPSRYAQKIITKTEDTAGTVSGREAVTSPKEEPLVLKPHESDAEIKAEQAAAKQREELAKRQSAPLKGSAGDLTPDIFGEGDTPLFNERRDTPKQKSLIDGLKAHQDEVKGWIKGEQKSGRINSMPIDILGAQAYDAALTSVIKLMETGVRIGKAVRTVIADIKKTRQLSRDEEATIKAALIAKSQDSLRFAGERDAKLMLEMPKIAEELVAQGKTPTQQDLIAALATRFPDQAPYIKAKGDKIFKDMMFARDKRLSRTTDSQREWGEWADNAIDGTRKMVDSFTKGAPLTNVKQFATNFHATYMTGIGNKMRHLAEGNITGNKSNAWGKWTEDLVGLAKGKDGVHRVSTDLEMNRDVTTFANHLDQIKTDLNPMLNAMPRGERKAFMERVGDHITDASRDGELVNQPQLKRAVEAYVKIREDLLKHMKDSGVEVGDVGPRSMRRVLDRPTILGNPDEFMKQAANAYKAKWRAEVAALNKEAAGLDPIKNKDRLATIQTELAEIAKRDAADSARKYLTNIEADEVGITSDGNDLFSHNNGNPSSMKSREFGPEADQLLGKFYLRDPDAILRREIGDSVRAAGVARTFSGPALDPQGNPRPNGEIDPMAKWKKLRQDLIDEGNPDMIPMAATLLKEHFNLGGQDSPAMRTALEIAHTHTQLAFLARSAFSSLGEPALAGIRAGSLRAVGEGYVKTFKGMARELRGLGPDEARIISNAIGTSNDGFNSILAANRFLDSYAVAGKSGELVAMFHAKTWLTALTNATHAASVDISHGFIRTQLELRQAGGKYKTVAGKHLNEIGITTADIPAMLKFTDDFAKSTDKVKLLTADTPEAKMYRDALHLVRMSGGSLQVLRGTRPQHANSPVGGMFYALKSFLFAFQDQVLSRHARLVQTAVKGETLVDGAMEKLSAAERTKMIGETVQAVATLAAAQYGIQVLRESLFSDPARMKEENKTPAEKARMRAYSVATRSSFFGGYDILFNAMTGARHGGDPSTAALGPSGGLAGSIFGQIAGIGGKKDSPNTNTHERKLTRSIFDFTAKPLANAATATLPGYKIATPLIQAFNHPGTREALVKTVAGPPMKGGPMKKKSPGF
jgi:hypothetical protein